MFPEWHTNSFRKHWMKRTQSREDVLSIVEEAIRAMGPDKGHLLDKLLALTGKEATQEKQQPVDESFDEVQMALLVMRAGTEVFGSGSQGFCSG